VFGERVDMVERRLQQGDAIGKRKARIYWPSSPPHHALEFLHLMEPPCDHHDLWFEPESTSYRKIVGYPHLNQCFNSLEILNMSGSNVLGKFLPFLLHTPKLKSLGQWL